MCGKSVAGAAAEIEGIFSDLNRRRIDWFGIGLGIGLGIG